MPLSAGQKAPDFTLKQGAELKNVTLSSHFGKSNVVLLFFPAAFTGVCTGEFCDISKGFATYEKLGAVVYGVSVDTPFAQAAWAKQEGITTPLLSDLNKTVTKAYDVLFPNLAEIGDTSARAAFVIDKQGVIRYAEQTPTPKDLPDFAKIQEVLSSLA